MPHAEGMLSLCLSPKSRRCSSLKPRWKRRADSSRWAFLRQASDAHHTPKRVQRTLHPAPPIVSSTACPSPLTFRNRSVTLDKLCHTQGSRGLKSPLFSSCAPTFSPTEELFEIIFLFQPIASIVCRPLAQLTKKRQQPPPAAFFVVVVVVLLVRYILRLMLHCCCTHTYRTWLLRALLL